MHVRGNGPVHANKRKDYKREVELTEAFVAKNTGQTSSERGIATRCALFIRVVPKKNRPQKTKGYGTGSRRNSGEPCVEQGSREEVENETLTVRSNPSVKARCCKRRVLLPISWSPKGGDCAAGFAPGAREVPCHITLDRDEESGNAGESQSQIAIC